MFEIEKKKNSEYTEAGEKKFSGETRVKHWFLRSREESKKLKALDIRFEFHEGDSRLPRRLKKPNQS